MTLPTNKNKSRGKASNQAFTESTRLSSHHWCIVSHVKTRNSDTGHKHSQHSFLFFFTVMLCWFELRGRNMARQITGLSVKIHRHRSHTGQCFLEKRISSIPLSNQPTSGTWRELRTSTNFISEQGRQEAPGGQKAVPNASASSIQQHLCRWQGLGSHGAADAAHQPPSKGLQDTASPFSAAPPAPPAEREPAASGGTGEATHSPKGAMNAILRPLPAHWHTSAHICSHVCPP